MVFPKNTQSALGVINESLENFSSDSKYKKYRESADIIISSGGPLNVQIVSHAAAIKNLGMLRRLLKKQGILIATGLSELAIKKKDMEKQHFTIFSTHSVQAVKRKHKDEIDSMRPMYVIRKDK